jgi:inhibitor of KinA sporulation pathway (predicted exonuclease)
VSPVKLLDQIVVVDIEATCWKGSAPPGEVQEIIEVGVCLLEIASGKRSAKRSLLVRPTRSKISRYCTKLTKITPKMAARGDSFAAVCATLVEAYEAPRRTWASWGNFDRRLFQSQCADMDVPYPFGKTHLNIKNLFALYHRLPKEIGLPRALRKLELGFEGTHHRGADDAWNAAEVLARLLPPAGVPDV